jgi:hypothetical protein
MHLYIIIAALVLSLSGARAQEPTFASGLACDTQAQVESFMAKYDGDNAPAVLDAVNAEPGNTKESCVATQFAYVERATVVARYTHRTGTYRIVQVSIVALPHPLYGWLRVENVEWFVAIPLNETAA